MIRRLLTSVLAVAFALPPCFAADGAPVMPPIKEFPNGVRVRVLSPAPAPGIHPRIILSPEDLPDLRARLKDQECRRQAWSKMLKVLDGKLLDPKSAEGAAFAIAAAGGTVSASQFASADLQWQMTVAGLDALVRDDRERGQALARLLAQYGAWRATTWVRKPDPVGLHNSFESNLCLAYDFIAPWMDEEQRKPVRAQIARMSDGIRIFTYNMPAHWRMWNWAALHTYQGWHSLAIEGEPGWNPTLWNDARTVARDVARFNVHPSGALTEDLHYFTFGFRGTGLVMTAMAKRGEADVWATSNVPAVKNHLLAQMVPWGYNFVSHADGAGNGLFGMFALLKGMYPDDPVMDKVWRNRVGDNYEINGPNHDGEERHLLTSLFGVDYTPGPNDLAALKQPVTFFCPDRGYLVTRTGWDADAMKLDFEAKQDAPTVGHNHADANNFTLSALGREWAIDRGYHAAGGQLHNEVLVDGVGESAWPAPNGRWVDLVDRPLATIGVSDAKHAYDWRWSDTGYSTENTPPDQTVKFEIETEPRVVAFYAGQENRTTTGIFDHWSPFLLRSVWNPVQRALRTAALVRGAHPYVLIVDDIAKDDQRRLYEWIMQVADDLEVKQLSGRTLILGPKDVPAKKDDKAEPSKPDKRRLLVQLVDADSSATNDVAMALRLETYGAGNSAYEAGSGKRVVIPARGVEPRFKVLLAPFTEGDPLPTVTWTDDRSLCTVAWPDQEDELRFAIGEGQRTLMRIERAGQELASTSARPAGPQPLAGMRTFLDRTSVAFIPAGQAQEIRYTTDGSTPNATSTLYRGPIVLDASATVTAVTVARRWRFGAQVVSTPVTVAVERARLLPAQSAVVSEPGLVVEQYRGFWRRLPDLATLTAVSKTGISGFVLPPGLPARGHGLRYTGFITVPASGVYAFGLTCDDAGKLWIDDQIVVDHDGPHVISEKTGAVALAAGTHRITLGACDHDFPLGREKGDGAWVLGVRVAPPGGALAELPGSWLSRPVGAVAAAAAPPAIPGWIGDPAAIAPGVSSAIYDHPERIGEIRFFASTGETPLLRMIGERLSAADTPRLLHVAEGLLIVPIAGRYEFAFITATTAELELGGTVVARAGVPGQDVTAPVLLPAGPVTLTARFGQGKPVLRWRGPGGDWQVVEPEDLARPWAPVIVPDGRSAGDLAYEVRGPLAVGLRLPAAPADVVVRATTDGSEPAAASPAINGPLTISGTTTLRVRAFRAGKPFGNEASAIFTAVAVPTRDLVAWWPGDRAEGVKLSDRIGRGAVCTVPADQSFADDAERGRVLQLVRSGALPLSGAPIALNALTLAFHLRITTPTEGNLFYAGYGPSGILCDLRSNGSLRLGGGGNWNIMSTKPKLIDVGRWQHVAAVFGDGMATLYIDGVSAGGGKATIPCRQAEIGMFRNLTGLVADLRVYNRVLTAEEVTALAQQATAK